jgi:hypothetical protein
LLPATGGGGEDAELGAEDGRFTAALEELANDGFGLAVAVGAGGVEEGDAVVEGVVEGVEGVFAGDAAGDGGAAETKLGEVREAWGGGRLLAGHRVTLPYGRAARSGGAWWGRI